jgi:hypothetical protein
MQKKSDKIHIYPLNYSLRQLFDLEANNWIYI